MELDIHAGKRILYKKNNNSWNVGELAQASAKLNIDGLFLPVYPQEIFYLIHSSSYTWDEPDYIYININDIFLEAMPLEDWIKDYKKYFMTKEEYIEFIESDEFEKALENSYVSDGEYIYYPVNKYTRNWIEKQPFDYIVRSDL